MFSSIFFMIFTIVATQVNADNKTTLKTVGENVCICENECTKQTTCEPLTNTTFFGTQLPYAMTTLDLIPGLEKSSHMIEQRFHQLKVAQYFPECWNALQPLLCALYKPKCLNGYYRMPGFRMCMKALIACEPIRDHPIWPKFIDCNNRTLFPRSCEDPTTNVEFNKISQCMEPLIPSESQSALGIRGCGLPCRDPLYTLEEHQQTDTIVWYGAWTCVFFSVFSILTILINHPVKKFHSTVLCTNILFVILCSGFLLQFTFITSREEIACHKDGTRRIGESITSNFMSSLVFLLIYFPLMSLPLQWLSYMQLYNCVVTGKPLKTKWTLFKIFWLILMFVIILFSKIDGSGITGITFKRLDDKYIIDFFIETVAYAAFVFSFLLYFCGGNRPWFGFIGKDLSDVDSIMRKIYLFTALIKLAFCYIVYYNRADFEKLQSTFLKDYIMCKIFGGIGGNECLMSKPWLGLFGKQLEILILFSIGILVSLLVCTKSGFQSWMNIFRGIAGKEEKENKFVLFIDLDGVSDRVIRLLLEEQFENSKKIIFTLVMKNKSRKVIKCKKKTILKFSSLSAIKRYALKERRKLQKLISLLQAHSAPLPLTDHCINKELTEVTVLK